MPVRLQPGFSVEGSDGGDPIDLKISASHGYAMAVSGARLRHIRASVEPSCRGSIETLDSPARGSCDMADFPVPAVFPCYGSAGMPPPRLLRVAFFQPGQ